MNFREDIWIDIEEYLDNTMDIQRLKDFENKLSSDPALRKELDFAWKLRRAVQQNEIDKFKFVHLKLSFWNRLWNIKYYMLKTLVAIFVIGAISIYIYYQNKILSPHLDVAPSNYDSLKRILPIIPNQSDKITNPIATNANANANSEELLAIAETHMNRYSDIDFQSNINRNNNATSELDTLSLARIAFNNKNWDESIKLYNHVQNLTEFSSDFASLGYSYLKIGNINKSIYIFTKLKESSILEEWRMKGQWYLLITYLKAGNQKSIDFEYTLSNALKIKYNNLAFQKRIYALKNEYYKLKTDNSH